MAFVAFSIFFCFANLNFPFFALLYADDTVLMSETSDGLQTLLNNVYEYSKLWKLKVNIIFLSSINCSRSFKNTANKKGDKFSSCLTPTSLEKKSD
jgi:hypothetical protein